MSVANKDLESVAPDLITTAVVDLYLHGPRASLPGDTTPTPMIAVQDAHAVATMGLEGSPERHWRVRVDGQESKRQVSLIDEATLARHRAQFGEFPAAFVKSQLVLAGDVHLPDLLGRELVFGDDADGAILQLTIKRDPCEEMDLIAPGLRAAMKGGEQGALARVIRGGRIARGQRVTIR